MGIVTQVVSSGREHCAPLRRRRLYAQANETEHGRTHDRASNAHGGLHDQGGQGVGQHVLPDDAGIGAVDGGGRLQVLHLSDIQDGGSRHAGVARDGADGKSDDAVGQTGSQGRRDGNGQHDTGHCLEHIQQAHDDVIHRPAEISGDCTEKDAANGGNRHTDQADPKRIATAIEQAAENITAKLIGTKPMLGAGGSVPIFEIRRFIGIRADVRCQKCEYNHHDNNDQANHRQMISLQPSQGKPELAVPSFLSGHIISPSSCSGTAP